MEIPINYAFLHGGGQGSWVWDETIAALAQQSDGRFGNALKLDVPGCGAKRGRDTAGLTLDDVIAELLADIESSALRDIVLVGHSQAGNVMPALAQRRPDLLRRLVYVSCSVPLPGQNILQMMGSGVHGSHPDEVGWPAQRLPSGQQDPQMFCNDMEPAGAETFVARLGKDAWPNQVYAHTDWHHRKPASVPATYVLLLRDRMLPLDWQQTFAQRFDADRLVRIDAGHQAMTSRPHTLAEVLRREAREDRDSGIAG
jgi:pimeloyl-ACP methyl ester carboxylesterase